MRSDPTGALSPLPGAFSRDDPLGVLGPGPAAYTRVAEWLAAHHYENELHRELVHHYVRGGGQPMVLSVAQMHQVIASGSAHLNLLWDDTRWPRIHAAQEQIQQRLQAGERSPITIWVNDSSTVFCDSDKPTLGAFQCWVDGAVTGFCGDAAPGAEMTPVDFDFTGTMHWHDWWDFDSHQPDPSGFPQTRTPDAETGTRRAHDWLPGLPFGVDSPTVPVHQPRAQARGGALW